MFQKILFLLMTLMFSMIPSRVDGEDEPVIPKIILLICPQCATLGSVPAGQACTEEKPGIEPSVAMRDACEVNVPAPDAGTAVVSLPVTINGGGSMFDFQRIDNTASNITGEKALDANHHTWTAVLFVPGNDGEMQTFREKVTTRGYKATCIVTDKIGNQYIYEEATFSYTYDSLTDTNDAGQPGTTLTLTTNIYPKIYTNTIP